MAKLGLNKIVYQRPFNGYPGRFARIIAYKKDGWCAIRYQVEVPYKTMVYWCVLHDENEFVLVKPDTEKNRLAIQLKYGV